MPIYMKVPGIDGEATEANHVGWIELSGLSSPIARKVPDGAYGTDAVSRGLLAFGPVEMSRRVDAASVLLARATAAGQVFDAVHLHVTVPMGGGEKTVLEYELGKAVLVSHGLNVVALGGGPQDLSENLSVQFARVKWTYKKYREGRADGVVTGGFDRVSGVSS
jgi:type VI protein secretion system component Hcp